MSFPDFTGAGTPEGSQVGAIGQWYEDTDTGNLYQKVDGAGMDTGWQGPWRTSGLADEVAAEVPTVVPFDNANHAVDCDTSTPPTWMDTTSHIIVPGLYQLGLNIGVTTPPTTAGLFYVASIGTDGFPLPVDSHFADIVDNRLSGLVLAAADVPYQVTGNVRAQNDVTGEITATAFVQRLGFYVP